MEHRKQAIIEALRAWIDQRPGFDPRNYDRAGYLSDSRRVQQQARDARELLRAVELTAEIDADALLAASRGAFSGRLTIDIKELENGSGPMRVDHRKGDIYVQTANVRTSDRVRIKYCTGQYWCTEYRAAACAVLASALWGYTRKHCMPAPMIHHMGDPNVSGCPIREEERYAGKSAGDWLRAHFRQQFGRSIAKRWFN
jgi:hypothetical protein